MKLPRLFRRRMVTISAVVTRADGTVEDLGVISKGRIRQRRWKPGSEAKRNAS